MPAVKPRSKADLTALLASRICHDLINPLGAVGNGVELLSMGNSGPELTLITQSITNANARIRFFRVAYGEESTDQKIGRPDVAAILEDITRGGRLAIDWQIAGEQPRSLTKLTFLAIQCLETAMPYGGRIAISETTGGWRVEGTAPRLKADARLWRLLSDPAAELEIGAAQVQFALFPEAAARLGLKPVVTLRETAITIAF